MKESGGEAHVEDSSSQAHWEHLARDHGQDHILRSFKSLVEAYISHVALGSWLMLWAVTQGLCQNRLVAVGRTLLREQCPPYLIGTGWALQLSSPGYLEAINPSNPPKEYGRRSFGRCLYGKGAAVTF